MSNEPIIAAAEPLLDSAKLSLAISAAPLALIAAQLRHLAAIDHVCLKALLMTSSISFLLATCLSLLSIYQARTLLSVLKFREAGGNEDDSPLVAFIKQGRTISEEQYVEMAKKLLIPMLLTIGTGYLTGILGLIILIWLPGASL